MAKHSPTPASRGTSKSPKQKTKSSPLREVQTSAEKPDPSSNTEPAKPLAPPPRPNQQSGNTPDYFASQVGGAGGSLSLEPNPFEQSFGGSSSAGGDTPNGTKLPSVASLTSPSSLLPGGTTPSFNWGGGSLRTGPLSPAMLSGPTNDYFGDTHLRGGFPTPNESSMRTGLTPGGSGSMFPAASPSSQAVFAQLQSGGATPGTLDFHRTAMTAAASKREQQAQLTNQANQQQTSAPTSAPQDPPAASVPASKPEAKAFDQDSNAANSLYLLAQGRGSAQPQAQFIAPPPPQPVSNTAVPLPTSVAGMPNAPPVVNQTPVPIPVIPGQPPVRGANGTSMTNGHGATNGTGASKNGRSTSEAVSAVSDESEPVRTNAKGRGKRNSSGDNGTAGNNRRKASDAPAKGPAAKKAKTAAAISPPQDDMSGDGDSQSDDDDNRLGKDGQPRPKMTEEEKRKNFLERNRVAALKCRQRKKQWLQNLQTKVELYSTENENLSSQINQLREEIVNLKTLLLAHKDCPITQQQGLHGTYLQQSIEPFNQQMNPYGMAAPMASQPVIAGQVNTRRFS
ncbi:activating transcription factor, other eukaryote [Sporothrix schenckii 1099-18]|uniref:Activating transcription factor, other eukaryote n=1 Tax=Sporothrix schenckii 1099-18 TaxID=1397361 RepID=A0A0F2M0K4_SPOSC|nr:activating transcription factor, other eukaryote [Sporothrix schenckii 1099-18]KJR83232.1 activating transcription factor, other eukaryote [Sporothrix schenckii 1099-18]